MMRILIVYGTTDGQTSKVALALSRSLRRAGVNAEAFPASPAAPDPKGYAGVIVAASLHSGRCQRSVRTWLKRHAAGIENLPTAFVGVGMLARDPRDTARLKVYRVMRGFADRSGWAPTYFKPVAGALRYSQYGWLKRWFVQRMAAAIGAGTDTRLDYEYTNWDDLDRFARAFAGAVDRLHEPRRDKAA